jgi:hypothetical protein
VTCVCQKIKSVLFFLCNLIVICKLLLHDFLYKKINRNCKNENFVYAIFNHAIELSKLSFMPWMLLALSKKWSESVISTSTVGYCQGSFNYVTQIWKLFDPLHLPCITSLYSTSYSLANPLPPLNVLHNLWAAPLTNLNTPSPDQQVS